MQRLPGKESLFENSIKAAADLVDLCDLSFRQTNSSSGSDIHH